MPKSKLPPHSPSLGELGCCSSDETGCPQRHAGRLKRCCNLVGCLQGAGVYPRPLSACCRGAVFVLVLPVLSINTASRKGTWAEGREASDQSKGVGKSGGEGCPEESGGTCALMPCRSLTGKIHPLRRVIMREGYPNLTCL